MDRYLRHPSRAARWNGTELMPVESSAFADTEVWAGWTEVGTTTWEALNATTVGADEVRICSVPAYAYGLNFGDTVGTIASAEGPLVVRGITCAGGQSTFRIWLGTDPDPSAWRPIAESYAKRGCIVDVLTSSLIALSCDVEDSVSVREHLEEDAARTSFIWEPGTPPS